MAQAAVYKWGGDGGQSWTQTYLVDTAGDFPYALSGSGPQIIGCMNDTTGTVDINLHQPETGAEFRIWNHNDSTDGVHIVPAGTDTIDGYAGWENITSYASSHLIYHAEQGNWSTVR